MSQRGDQIGIGGAARGHGIPAGMVLTWIGPSTTSRVAVMFSGFRKGRGADITKNHGLDGDWRGQRRRNKVIHLVYDCVAEGADEAAARAIAADLPGKGDLASVTGATDTSINNSGTTSYGYVVENEPEASYTPENAVVFSIEIIQYLADDGTKLIPVALS